MIAVGFSRRPDGTPVMLEKAQPSTERLFYEDGPSMAEEARMEGRLVMFDCVGGAEHEPQRRYSHSSADLD